eukprot:PhM_4_TR16552/c0_g1_i1/m.101289
MGCCSSTATSKVEATDGFAAVVVMKREDGVDNEIHHTVQLSPKTQQAPKQLSTPPPLPSTPNNNNNGDEQLHTTDDEMCRNTQHNNNINSKTKQPEPDHLQVGDGEHPHEVVPTSGDDAGGGNSGPPPPQLMIETASKNHNNHNPDGDDDTVQKEPKNAERHHHDHPSQTVGSPLAPPCQIIKSNSNNNSTAAAAVAAPSATHAASSSSPLLAEDNGAQPSSAYQQQDSLRQRSALESKLRDLRRWLDGQPPEPVASRSGSLSGTGSDLSLTIQTLADNVQEIRRLELAAHPSIHLTATSSSPRTTTPGNPSTPGLMVSMRSMYTTRSTGTRDGGGLKTPLTHRTKSGRILTQRTKS